MELNWAMILYIVIGVIFIWAVADVIFYSYFKHKKQYYHDLVEEIVTCIKNAVNKLDSQQKQ